MFKKVLFAAVATALVAAVALPIQFTPAAAGAMSCKEAAKMRRSCLSVLLIMTRQKDHLLTSQMYLLNG